MGAQSPSFPPPPPLPPLKCPLAALPVGKWPPLGATGLFFRLEAGLGLGVRLGLGVKGRACVSEIELDGHVQCTLGFKENNFQTQRAAPT